MACPYSSTYHYGGEAQFENATIIGADTVGSTAANPSCVTLEKHPEQKPKKSFHESVFLHNPSFTHKEEEIVLNRFKKRRRRRGAKRCVPKKKVSKKRVSSKRCSKKRRSVRRKRRVSCCRK
jgi:hypothetical protein